MDEWYNAVQIQVALTKYPQDTAKILHRDKFWFFLNDQEFVSKTINDSNIDLNKFPAIKVRPLAKKMESSKATAKEIKQVASDPQAAQIHLMHHQHALSYHPTSVKENRGNNYKSRQDTTKQHYYNEEKQRGSPECTRNMKHTCKSQIDVRSVVIHNMLRDLDVQLVSTNVKIVISLVILVACATRRKSLNTRGSQVPEHIN